MSTREILDNDNDLFDTTSALVWAERFVERVEGNPSIATDVGAMLAWFAGAIETGRSAGIEQMSKRPEVPVEIRPSPFVARPTCAECGLALSGVMGYVCSHPTCPTGLGGPRC